MALISFQPKDWLLALQFQTPIQNSSKLGNGLVLETNLFISPVPIPLPSPHEMIMARGLSCLTSCIAATIVTLPLLILSV
eukprot:8520108-Ditylum_brightwellii.AAC.1